MIAWPTGRELAWWLVKRAAWYATLGPVREYLGELARLPGDMQRLADSTHELLARLDREEQERKAEEHAQRRREHALGRTGGWRP